MWFNPEAVHIQSMMCMFISKTSSQQTCAETLLHVLMVELDTATLTCDNKSEPRLKRVKMSG